MKSPPGHDEVIPPPPSPGQDAEDPQPGQDGVPPLSQARLCLDRSGRGWYASCGFPQEDCLVKNNISSILNSIPYLGVCRWSQQVKPRRFKSTVHLLAIHICRWTVLISSKDNVLNVFTTYNPSGNIDNKTSKTLFDISRGSCFEDKLPYESQSIKHFIFLEK